MRICEIFNSIQGEGIYTGVPSVFIRTAGCNLKCTWCDTKFSWSVGKKYKIEDILKEVDRYPSNHAVITGGEPLIQVDEVVKLIESLTSRNKAITIETNGSVYLKLNMDNLFYSISPKLSSSKQDYDWVSVVNQFLQTHCNKIQLKFVIASEEDYHELKQKLREIKNPTKYVIPLILQPDGMTNTLNDYVKNYGDLSLKTANDPYWKNYKVRVLMQNHRVAWKQSSGK